VWSGIAVGLFICEVPKSLPREKEVLSDTCEVFLVSYCGWKLMGTCSKSGIAEEC